jgi:hypothetical protein
MEKKELKKLHKDGMRIMDKMMKSAEWTAWENVEAYLLDLSSELYLPITGEGDEDVESAADCLVPKRTVLITEDIIEFTKYLIEQMDDVLKKLNDTVVAIKKSREKLEDRLS